MIDQWIRERAVGLVVMLAIIAIWLGYFAVSNALYARMYRKSRDRWRAAFWEIGPALGSPPADIPEDE